MITVILTPHESLKEPDDFRLAIFEEKVDRLDADAGVVVALYDLGEGLAGFGFTGVGPQAVEGLEADTGVGIAAESVEENLADFVAFAVVLQQVHGIDAEAGVGGVGRGGKQHVTDLVVLKRPGHFALADLIIENADLAGISRIDKADAGD